MIYKQMCSSRTCHKCLIGLQIRYKLGDSDFQRFGSGRIRHACEIVLTLPNCCPVKLVLLFGFDKGDWSFYRVTIFWVYSRDDHSNPALALFQM